jgi:hypothetical protein
VAAVVVLLAAAALAAPRLLGGSTDEPSRGQSASPSASPSPAPSPRPEEDLARPRLDGVRAALPPDVALVVPENLRKHPVGVGVEPRSGTFDRDTAL